MPKDSIMPDYLDEFKKPYNPHLIEEKIYNRWLEAGFFNPDKLPGKRKKVFCIMMAPPNITGHIHVGHALENILSDILIRYKRMQGYKTLFLPGKDHAGIAAQYVVEKQLRKEGTNRFELGKEKFLEKMWQWMKEYGDNIDRELKKLGLSCDWSRKRFTMDNDYQKAVQAAFSHYRKKGWIYRGKRMVNWCARCQTNISDLEVEYQEEKGKLWYIKYKIKNQKSKIKNTNKNSKISKYITVATTRPETMLGDAGVAVNPGDKRYKDLIGLRAVLPIQNREIPIIADELVDKDFGTGAVKVTPAHDVVDFEIAQKHRLPFYYIIDERGKMTRDSSVCDGLSVSECREKVLSLLKEGGFLEKEEDYIHNIGVCERCKTVIEPLISEQWFLSMKELAKMAIKDAKENKIKFIPASRKKIFINWFKNIKDWNISRQLWWGHQLPVWFCKQNQTGRIFNFQFPISKQTPNSKFQIPNSEGNFVVSLKEPKKCPFCKNCNMEQSADVLDTWFSSALWSFAALGWPIARAQNQKSKIKNQKCKPIKGSDLDKFYPTTIISSAREIFFLWIGRMVFSGLEFMKKAPFKIIYIHSTILDKEGRKMSKSLGNIIDPMNLVVQYGTDATRFGLIWQATGHQDIHWSEDAFSAGKKFCNKIWNASRFVLEQTANSKFKIQNSKLQFKNQKLTEADQRILKKLASVKQEIENDLDKFDFGQTLHKIYEFFWREFCDVYIEKSKAQIANRNLSENTKQILLYVLLESLKILHPFMPFITEEIYSNLPFKDKKLIMIENW